MKLKDTQKFKKAVLQLTEVYTVANRRGLNKALSIIGDIEPEYVHGKYFHDMTTNHLISVLALLTKIIEGYYE
jgi:hypothetical protein